MGGKGLMSWTSRSAVHILSLDPWTYALAWAMYTTTAKCICQCINFKLYYPCTATFLRGEGR